MFLPDHRRFGTEVVTDHDRRVGVGVGRCAGQQVVGGRGQCVLVGPAVDLLTLELLRGGVADGADRHVRTGEVADPADLTGDPEVDQHDPVVAGLGRTEQDVRRFDVTVQQPAAVRVVQRVGHRRDDANHLGGRDAPGVASQQPRGVDPVDELHRDPQPAVELAAVVDRDDVRMTQGGHHLGFEIETPAVLLVVADRVAEHLQRIPTGQPGMLREIDLAHPAETEQANDCVAGEVDTVRQRSVLRAGILRRAGHPGATSRSRARTPSLSRASSAISSSLSTAVRISAIRRLVVSSTSS